MPVDRIVGMTSAAKITWPVVFSVSPDCPLAGTIILVRPTARSRAATENRSHSVRLAKVIFAFADDPSVSDVCRKKEG